MIRVNQLEVPLRSVNDKNESAIARIVNNEDRRAESALINRWSAIRISLL